ncbi:HNH endonuclease [Limnoglobus roseus]
MLQSHARWRAANKGKLSALHRNRRARKKNATGTHTAEQIADLLWKQRNKCFNCLRKLDGKYHADHVAPLARGGTNDIGNIQILCPSCNCRKHAKDPIRWAQEQGRLL